MKKLLFFALTFLVLFFSKTFSQIIINQADMPLVGDVIQTATDTLTPGLAVGNAGANQVWDFSSLTPDRINTDNVVNPNTTPAGGSFPTANRAITRNSLAYNYFRVTAQRYEQQGAVGDLLGLGFSSTVVYNPVNELYRFPTQFGGNFNSNYGFVVITPFSDLPPNIQQDINSQLPAGVTISRLRTTFTSTFNDQIDGWGTTITPVCSYKSLRQVREENITFLVEADAFLGLIPLGWQEVVNENTIATSYNWLAKETKLPLVSVTLNAQGDVNTATYNLIPPALDADFTASTINVCAGGSLDFSDATYGCPTSWSWSFTGGTPSTSTDENPTGIVYNTPGTYPVSLTVIRGSVNNTETKNMYITVNALPVATASNDTICLNETGSLVAAGGTTYIWSSGETTATLNASPAVTTNYSVTVTNTNNCSNIASATLVVYSLPVSDAGANDTICPGETGLLTATGGISYLWNTGSTTSSLSAAPPVTTEYIVTVTDINGCTDRDTAAIVIKPIPVMSAGINDTICRNQTATLTGSGTGDYLWSNGETTTQINISPTANTTYTLTVTGANGCSASATATVVVNQLPAKTLNSITFCPGSTTVLDAGNPGAVYVWSTGASNRTITVDATGEYSVTVTDTKGCINSDTATVTVSTSLTVILNDYEFCNGDSVVLDAGNFGSDFEWSTGSTAQAITVFTTGVYEVTVTDAIGCEGQNLSNITVFDLPIADAGDNDTICFSETGFLDGSGATGDYLWTVTGDTSLSTSNAPASTTVYYLSITDANNCVASDSAYIVVNTLPLVDAASNDTICFGETGSLLATGTGDFLWNTGDITADISESPSITTLYTVVVTDANGCTASDAATIVVNQLPIVSAGGDKGICDGDSVTLTATGGIDYLWNTGDNTASITMAPDTFSVFSVLVTDINGCADEDSASITLYSNPVVAIAGLDSAYCPNADDIVLAGTPTGGIFSGSGVMSGLFSPSQMPVGVFDVFYTYTDSNNCTSADTLLVEVFSETNVILSGITNTYCEDDTIVVLLLTPSGGVVSGSGVSGNTFNPELAGAGGPYTLSYTFIDNNGCVYVAERDVTVNAVPEIDFSGIDDVYCSESSPVLLDGIPSGGTFSGTAITNNTFDPELAGIGIYVFTYSITSVAGCSNTDSISVYVEVCGGIRGYAQLEGVNIFPNPATKEFFVEFLSPINSDISMTLFDVSGRQIENFSNQPAAKFDVSNLQPGVYFVRVLTESKIAVRKIVVQKF